MAVVKIQFSLRALRIDPEIYAKLKKIAKKIPVRYQIGLIA